MTKVVAGTHTFPIAFLNEVLEGFSKQVKSLSPRWLYDDAGSALFEQITELPEYYVTRVETTILTKSTPDFAQAIGPEASVVEYGAGAAVKTRHLLDALERPANYYAIDISADHLTGALAGIDQDYPDLTVHPVPGDFLSDDLKFEVGTNGNNVGFFPGSTIGNLTDEQISAFMSQARKLLGPQSWFLLGADLRKDPSILIPAYDDAAGVTARFNKNLLVRINRELRGTIEVDQFAHEARWNEHHGRIEMHLESLEDQTFTIAGERFRMQQGETIHTENSRKFHITDVEELARANGWEPALHRSDPYGLFAVILLQAA